LRKDGLGRNRRAFANRSALAAIPGSPSPRHAPDSLIHHSDCGPRCASNLYIEPLESRGVNISTTRPANPCHNAKAEEVNGRNYLDFDDAKRKIGAFIETANNAKRLRSALGYKPPAESEAELKRTGRQPMNSNPLSLIQRVSDERAVRAIGNKFRRPLTSAPPA